MGVLGVGGHLLGSLARARARKEDDEQIPRQQVCNSC
jgi:hypothetical protein